MNVKVGEWAGEKIRRGVQQVRCCYTHEQVLSYFFDPEFDIEDFTGTINHLYSNKEMGDTYLGESLNEAGISKTVIEVNGENRFYGFIMYYKDVLNVIQRQIYLASEDGDMHFRP